MPIFRLILVFFLFSPPALAMFIDLSDAPTSLTEKCGNEAFKNLPLVCNCSTGGVSFKINQLEKNIASALRKNIPDPKVAQVPRCTETILQNAKSIAALQQPSIRSALDQIATFNRNLKNKIKSPVPQSVCISENDLTDATAQVKTNCADPCGEVINAAKNWVLDQIRQSDSNSARRIAIQAVNENAQNGIVLSTNGTHLDLPAGCASRLKNALKSLPLSKEKSISASPQTSPEQKQPAETKVLGNENPLAQVCKKWETDCDDCKQESFKIIDDITRKAQEMELKKLLYEKSMERLLAGVENFQEKIKIGGREDSPSEKLKDLICCDSLNSCLEGTSYGPSTMTLETGYKNDSWQPAFCKGRKTSCNSLNHSPSAVNSMDTEDTRQKLSLFSKALKEQGLKIVSGYKELKHLTYEETGCTRPLKPSQVKTGDPKCVARYLNPSELAKKILLKKMKTATEQNYVNNYNDYVAKHKVLALHPYVLLLTKDLGAVYSGKNLNEFHGFEKSINSMSQEFSDQQIKNMVENFSVQISRDAVCSMKRLFAGKPAGQNGDLVEDRCLKENLDLMSMVRHNQNVAAYLIEGDEKVTSTLTSQNMGRMICVPYVASKDCNEFWKKWDPYIYTGKLGAGIAASFVVPWITIPYFYADAAISIVNSLDEMQDAKNAQDQLFAQYLKNEIASENLLGQYEESETRISSSQASLIFSVLSGATTIATGEAFKNLGKKFILKAKGTAKDLEKLDDIILSGNIDELEKFVKKTTGLEIEIIEDTLEGIKKTLVKNKVSVATKKSNAYTPIVSPKNVKSSQVTKADQRVQQELQKMNIKFEKTKSVSAVQYNVDQMKTTQLIVDSGSTPDYGQVYKIITLPKATGKKHFNTPALNHPEMALYKKQLEDMGYTLAVDSSMSFSGFRAYFNPTDKILALSPKTPWEIFKHEFQHAEFNKYIQPHFSKLVKAAKQKGPLKNTALNKLLNNGSITPEKAQRLEELLKKGLPNRAIDETLSVDEQLKLIGLRRYIPGSGTYNEKYALKHQISELLKLQRQRQLSKVQLRTLKEAKARYNFLRTIDYSPTLLALGGAGAVAIKNDQTKKQKEQKKEQDPNSYQQIIYSTDGKKIFAQESGGDWIEVNNDSEIKP